MILMFSLGREDVFAVDDLGIRNAMVRIYGLQETDKKKPTDRIRISDGGSIVPMHACLGCERHEYRGSRTICIISG